MIHQREVSVRSRRPRSDGQRTREALLHSAITCFAEKGFDGISARAIAQHAGVDAALVSRYFDSKEGLFIAALEQVTESQREALRETIQQTVLEDLGMVLARTAIAAEENPLEQQFFLRGALSPSTAHIVVEHAITPGHQLFIELLEGEATASRAHAIVNLMIGAAAAQTLNALMPQERELHIQALATALQSIIEQNRPA